MPAAVQESGSGEVVDLLTALRESLARAGGKKPEPAKKAPAKKAVAKKAPAKKAPAKKTAAKKAPAKRTRKTA